MYAFSFFALIETVLQKEKSGSLSNALNNSSMARPGFKPNDFCVYQLISITYKNLSNLWCQFFPRSLRYFSRFTQGIWHLVWHEAHLYKRKNNGINGNAPQLIESCLNNRRQRVVLTGQSSSLQSVRARVPQGSVLKTLFFLIYNNDLTTTTKL